MILSAHIFLILCFPLLLLGAPTPLHDDDQSVHPLPVDYFPADHLPGTNIVQFVDYTDHFIDHNLGPLESKVPRHTWYRLSSSHDRIFIKRGQTVELTEPAIAATKSGYLLLLQTGSKVSMSADLRVPSKKTIRVVDVPLDTQDSIWDSCLTFYRQRHNALQAHFRGSREIETEEEYMCRCFHTNMWHVGGPFIEVEVKAYPPNVHSRYIHDYQENVD